MQQPSTPRHARMCQHAVAPMEGSCSGAAAHPPTLFAWRCGMTPPSMPQRMEAVHEVSLRLRKTIAIASNVSERVKHCR